MEVVLKWKSRRDHFLSPDDQEEIRTLPYLKSLLHPSSQPVDTESTVHQGSDNITHQQTLNVHVSRESETPHNHQQTTVDLKPNETSSWTPPPRHESTPPQNPSLKIQSDASHVTFNLVEGNDVVPQLDTHSELDEQSYREALQKLGGDILRLRQENNHLESEKAFLNEQISQLKTRLNSRIDLSNKRELEVLAKSDLVCKAVDLQNELDLERSESNKYRQKVQALQNELIKKNDFEAEFDLLKDAHKEQQMLVQKLQRKVDKYRKCYEMALQQEEVIAQLETLVSKLPKSQPHHATHEVPVGRDARQGTHTAATQASAISEDVLRMADDHISQIEGILSHSHHDPSVVTILENSLVRENQIQQTLKSMDLEIKRLQQENDHLHTQFSSIIKAVQKRRRRQEEQRPREGHRSIRRREFRNKREEDELTECSVGSENQPDPLVSF